MVRATSFNSGFYWGQHPDEALHKEVQKKLFQPFYDPEIAELLKETAKQNPDKVEKAFEVLDASTVIPPPGINTVDAVQEVASNTFASADSSPLDPMESQVQKASDTAKKALDSKNVVKTSSPLGTLTNTLNPRGLLPLIPIFFWFLYHSEEKHLHNITIKCKIPPSRKITRITLGNKNEGRSIFFETAQGKPLELMRNKQNTTVSSLAASLFNSKSLMSWKNWPIIQNFVWKRESHYLHCKVEIYDPYDPALEKGPRRHDIPLSEYETISLIEQNQYASTSLDLPVGDNSEFASMNKLTIHVDVPANEEKNPKRISLEHLGAPFKEAYLEIEQKFIS